MGTSATILSLLSLFFIFHLHRIVVHAGKNTYMVFMKAHTHVDKNTSAYVDQGWRTEFHYDFLGSFLESAEEVHSSIIYSYKTFNGFAAKLDDEVAASMAEHPEVGLVSLSTARKLHTTRSWNFMGLKKDKGAKSSPNSIWQSAIYGNGMIIANIDTGVWPESKSFGDDRMGPIPSKWTGMCQNDFDPSFRCNRKLIGARYFNKAYAAENGPLNSSFFDSPRDEDGHGSHTLSTAAGNFVGNVSVFGLGKGTIAGGAPQAHVAAYKACYPMGCYDADILAAFDMAVQDGVDVLSVSLGGSGPIKLITDGVAIGSFHAAANSGIVVVTSAGNSGPDEGTVANTAPWQITVGAGTIDRRFTSYVILGNLEYIWGESMSEKAISKGDSFFPLISAADAGVANVSAEQAILCKPSTLDPSKAKGKILVCLRGENARVEKGEQCALAGAVGMILANSKEESFETLADPHLLPASDIDYRSGLQVFHYINSTRSPQAYITHPRSQLYTEESAPRIAAFSAKGPNEIVNEILKPDIVAPGVNIIAAFTEENSPTESKYDARRIPYNVMSGTSMSCPHVAGVAGLLKRLHPDWSPAAIRSALMTTATTWDNKLGPILNASKLKATPLELGAGHIRPSKAMDPGLVYDLTRSDYLNLLCARGYNQRQLSIFSKGPYTCPRLPINPINFNYPSITIPNLSGSVTVTRTVKNVGSSQSYYNVAVKEPIGISVLVTPQVLAFETMGEEKTFRVTFTVQNPATVPKKYLFGELNWRDSTHNVTSPLVVRPT